MVKVSVFDPVNSNPDNVIPSAIPIDLVLSVVKFNIEFDPKYVDDIQGHLWFNKNNPELDEKERFRRTLAIWREAIEYKWPMQEAEQKLLALHSLIKKVNEYKNGNS